MPDPSLAERQGFGRTEAVTIDARKWHAMRRQMLRMVMGYRFVETSVDSILAVCRHAPECPRDRAIACLPECPDREIVLSALVILHNAAQFEMLSTALPTRINADYRPPSREQYDAVVSEGELLREGRDVLAEIEQAMRLAEAAAGGARPAPWDGEIDVPAEHDAPEVPRTRLLPPEPVQEEETPR